MTKLTIIIPFKGSIKDLDVFLNNHHSIIESKSISSIFVVCKDDEGQVAKEYLYLHKIKVIMQTRKGIYNAFNDGVTQVDEGYVLFCGVDDTILISCHEISLDNQSSDMIFIPYKKHGKIILPKFASDKMQAQGFMESKLGMPHSHQGIVYSAKYLKNHLFSDDYEIAGDYNHLIHAMYQDSCTMSFAEKFKILIDVGGEGVSTRLRRLNRSESWRSYRLKFGIRKLFSAVIRKRLNILLEKSAP